MEKHGGVSRETVLENRYLVQRQIAQGQNARVYQGRHLGLDIPIVIKQLHSLYPDPRQASEQVLQYQVEARLLAKLRHPNLVLVLDTFLWDGLPVLVAEMIPGRTLEELSTLSPEPFPESTVLEWAGQLLDTLDYLHSQVPPVIVRGLKPSNVVLDPTGRLRLIDFGLAKSMDEKGAGTREIVKGLGEQGFAPLEQSAYGKTDARTDLYALGAILYFLLSKRVPPSASQRVVSPSDPLVDLQTLNSTVSQTTWQAVKTLMSLRANERPISAVEARGLLPIRRAARYCVDCGTLLQTTQIDLVEVDICTSCHGLWLDENELESLRHQMQIEKEISVGLAETVPLSPDHPAMRALEGDEPKRSFWTQLYAVFGGSRS